MIDDGWGYGKTQGMDDGWRMETNKMWASTAWS
jgi:hypothetical protein